MAAVPAGRFIKIGAQELRLHCRSRFGGNYEQRVRRVNRCRDRRDLAGVAGVEHVQLWATLCAAEDARDHLGAEARSAHAEQHRVLEAFGFFTEHLERVWINLLYAGGGEPPEPFALVLAGPERGIALPQPARPSLGASGFEARGDSLLKSCREIDCHQVLSAAEECRAFSRNRAKQCIRRIGEQRHARLDQPGGDVAQFEAETLGFGQHMACVIQIIGQCGQGRAMVTERVHRPRRHRVDSVGSDQRVDVECIGVGGVLNPG